VRPRIIGLTGGIASGKTLVASFFKKKKVPVIDADDIARDVVQPGRKAYRAIVEVFGEGIVKADKTLNRERLGTLVFRDEKRRRILEAITHPEILKLIQKRVAELRKKKVRALVVDAALLFESGLYKEMAQTILVTIHPKIQLRRLMKRDHLPETEAWTRILAQIPSAEKEKKADFMIDNSGTRLQTFRQFTGIWKKIT